jgi:hypothetical protein
MISSSIYLFEKCFLFVFRLLNPYRSHMSDDDDGGDSSIMNVTNTQIKS